MKLVVALGGNALLRRGESLSHERQAQNVRRSVDALVPLIRAGHQVAITHGNGPQIGLLAATHVGAAGAQSWPLDVLGAETEGMIGYQLERELQSQLPPEHLVATLLTQVLVESGDPAFGAPTKPVGALYARAEAERLARERGWSVGEDRGGWRRLVPSPRPRQIAEARVIEFLFERGVVVICAGGGGIPVVERESGALVGVEAVIDKDLTSALLATQLRADHLLLLTDVDAVYLEWATPSARPIARAGLGQLRGCDFAPGSMGPKIDAALEFAGATGRPASIGRMEDAAEILAGRAGTRISVGESAIVVRD